MGHHESDTNRKFPRNATTDVLQKTNGEVLSLARQIEDVCADASATVFQYEESISYELNRIEELQRHAKVQTAIECEGDTPLPSSQLQKCSAPAEIGTGERYEAYIEQETGVGNTPSLSNAEHTTSLGGAVAIGSPVGNRATVDCRESPGQGITIDQIAKRLAGTYTFVYFPLFSTSNTLTPYLAIRFRNVPDFIPKRPEEISDMARKLEFVYSRDSTGLIEYERKIEKAMKVLEMQWKDKGTAGLTAVSLAAEPKSDGKSRRRTHDFKESDADREAPRGSPLRYRSQEVSQGCRNTSGKLMTFGGLQMNLGEDLSVGRENNSLKHDPSVVRDTKHKTNSRHAPNAAQENTNQNDLNVFNTLGHLKTRFKADVKEVFPKLIEKFKEDEDPFKRFIADMMRKVIRIFEVEGVDELPDETDLDYLEKTESLISAILTSHAQVKSEMISKTSIEGVQVTMLFPEIGHSCLDMQSPGEVSNLGCGDASTDSWTRAGWTAITFDEGDPNCSASSSWDVASFWDEIDSIRTSIEEHPDLEMQANAENHSSPEPSKRRRRA